MKYLIYTFLLLISISSFGQSIQANLDGRYQLIGDVPPYAVTPYKYVNEEIRKRDASYQYVYRIGTELNVVYVYGTKAIEYNFFRDSAYGMRYCRRLYSSDVDTTTGLANTATRRQNGANWQGMALRYKLPDSTSRKWTPYHAGSLSNRTLAVDSLFLINGQKYDYEQIPTSPTLFETFSIIQTIGSSYNNNGINEVEWILSYLFDSKQLSLDNRYRILKNIDVERWFGSRLSLDSCDRIVTNNGGIYVNLKNNLSPSYSDNSTSLSMSNNNVNAYADVGDLFFNISADKSFFNSNSMITVFNRTSGSQDFYWNLAPLLNLQYTRIDSGSSFRSGNRICHIPIGYTNTYTQPSIISSTLTSFVNGGNSFTSPRFGANNSTDLFFETNNTDRLVLGSDGNLAFGSVASTKLSSNQIIYTPANTYIQSGVSTTGSGFLQGLQSTGTSLGFGMLLSANAYYNGTNYIQPRGGIASYLIRSTSQNGISLTYAAASGSNNSIISQLDIASFTSSGSLFTIRPNHTGDVAILNSSGLLGIRTYSQLRSDIGANNASNINTGTLGVSVGGTGLSSLGTSNQQLRVNSGATALEYFTSQITNSGSLDFPSTNIGQSSELTITVTGAADGDVVALGVPNVSTNANSCFTARVSSANTVTVKFNNYSSGAIDPASGTFKVTVMK